MATLRAMLLSQQLGLTKALPSYAGLQMQLPESLLAGLMWFDPDRLDALQNVRHLAQERDGESAHVAAVILLTGPAEAALQGSASMAGKRTMGRRMDGRSCTMARSG